MTITATFDMVNTAGADQARVDLLKGVASEAMRLWGNALAGDATISVRIEIAADVPAQFLATGEPTRGAVIGLPGQTGYWVSSVALQLAGNVVRNGSADPDITIRVNSNTLSQLYLDPTPASRDPIPADKYDGVGLLLHEIGHGIGFYGSYDEATKTFAGGTPSPYDSRIVDTASGLFFMGPNTKRHLILEKGNYVHYSSDNPGYARGLMTPVLYYQNRLDIGTAEYDILADIGIGTVSNDILDLPFMPAMRGGDADDTIRGGPGDNLLQGDAGNDIVSGGAGNDRLLGGDGNDSLIGDSGNDVLDGGTGVDNLRGGAGNDVYIVDDMSDRVFEFAVSGGMRIDSGGIDTVQSSATFNIGQFNWSRYVENLVLTGTDATEGFGNALGNRITGNSAANNLFGLAGDDILRGGDGNDVLRGQLGADTLIGGAGADQFVFDTKPRIPGNRDRIMDFNHEEGDQIVLARQVMPALPQGNALTGDAFYAAPGATSAHDASDRIVYNTRSGVLYYDADGLGGQAAVALAALKGAPVLALADFVLIA